MAIAGQVKQHQGPFQVGKTININNGQVGYCVIGFSVNEDDFMENGQKEDKDHSVYVQLTLNDNGNIKTEEIWIGRTYIYQTQEQINIQSVTFPQGAPASFLMDIIYCQNV